MIKKKKCAKEDMYHKDEEKHKGRTNSRTHVGPNEAV